MKQRRYGEVLPVRLSETIDTRLKDIADATGLTKSAALRLAIAHGLPELEAGRINLVSIQKEKTP